MARIAMLPVSCTWRFTFKAEAFLHLLLADFFSPCTFVGPWSVTNKSSTAIFNAQMEKPQCLKHFYNNAIKVEGGRVYLGMPGQHLKSTN